MKPFYLLLFLSFLLFSCTPSGSLTPTATSMPTSTSQPSPTLALPTSTTQPSPVIPTNTAAPATIPIPVALSNPSAAGSLRRIVDGLEKPVYLTHAADGSGRLFIVEQPGTIRILQGGKLLPDLFLDLRNLVNASGDEQGLLGLAFHPRYRENGRFFVNYTDVNGDTVIARYSVSADNPDRADPASATTILHIKQPFSNHNGGDLVFGPDGYLYIGMGDGGSQGDPQGNAQNLDTLLGKLLRIDVNADLYAIPPRNPFINRAGAKSEIWAYGLRNPWRFSFDSATGDLYIGDVGQNTYEEIDFQSASSLGGENYGWNFMEGLHPYKGVAPGGLTSPIAEYMHKEGSCSVVGGYVYHGSRLPQLTGMYLYGDYCSGLIWGLYHTVDGWQSVKLLSSNLAISSFGEDEAGELYMLDHRGGSVYLWEVNSE